MSTRRRLAAVGAPVAAVAAAALLPAGSLAPFRAHAAPERAAIPRVTFTDTRLGNGLRVLVSEDHRAPVVSIAVTYNVGSRDERPGRTGFAHLFEHMMFKGSANVGPGEHMWLIFSNGGTLNGTTNKDRTLYFETLPANQLDLALFLEADRMRSLEITKENLDNQRHAVQEERRLRVDNQPYGRTFEIVDELAYDNFAYEHSVIGSMADLDAASVEDVAAFFTTYYAPNNAALAIVGDVDTRACLEKVRRYFEAIPSQPPPPAVDLREPPQREERRRTLDDRLARLARVDLAFKVPPSFTADDDALQVLADVLGSGRSSRLYEALVRQKQLAVSASAFRVESRGPGLFRIVATAAPGKRVEELEESIHAEIEGLKVKGIAPWELEKARNAARRALAAGLLSSLDRAVGLSEYAALYGDPNLINTRAERLAAVTAADVQRVARTYLTPENRTVVITRPAQAPTAARSGAPVDRRAS
ncbi:MAG TPA: pitrilysin family protein [Vicinamibacterales bacterium]|nr:pitrilysin family protein [Vicinamibacterales bacterium]